MEEAAREEEEEDEQCELRAALLHLLRILLEEEGTALLWRQGLHLQGEPGLHVGDDVLGATPPHWHGAGGAHSLHHPSPSP